MACVLKQLGGEKRAWVKSLKGETLKKTIIRKDTGNSSFIVGEEKRTSNKIPISVDSARNGSCFTQDPIVGFPAPRSLHPYSIMNERSKPRPF